jgi:hypothetical protein
MASTPLPYSAWSVATTVSGPNDHFQTDRQSRTSAATTPETGELLTHGYSNQKAPQIPVAIMSATSNQGMTGLSKMLVVSAVDFGIITGSYYYRRERDYSQSPTPDAQSGR